jgi:hypothetical protein
MKDQAKVVIDGVRITPAFVNLVREIVENPSLTEINVLKDDLFMFISILMASSKLPDFDGEIPYKNLSESTFTLHRMLTAIEKLQADGEFIV